MLGIPRRKALGFDWKDALRERVGLFAFLNRALRGEASETGNQVEVKTENGVRFLELNLTQLNDSDGKRMSTVIFISDVTRMKKQDVRVERQYEANGACVCADMNQMEHVLLNIFLNGLQAMPQGGKFKVSILSVGDSGQEKGTGEKPCRWVQTAVANTGPPIPASDLPRIFDPFFTTKEKGTGMGLALAHAVVKSHKGTIRVESFPPDDTRFIIELPEFKPARGESNPESGGNADPGSEETAGGD